MNLKESKQSNCLVAIYLNEMPLEQSLAECFYSLTEQSSPVDVAIITSGLNDEQVASITNTATNSFYTLIKRAENGETITERVSAKNTLNFVSIKSEALTFAQLFNTVFNMANKNGYEKISFVEAEDSFSLKWFELAQKYSEENPEVAVLLPLIRNSINNAFSGLLNEAAWAEGMAEEAGKVDINLLMRFNCVNPLGAIYKIDAIKEYSELDEATGNYLPMKESIRLSHYYEFFLRMIYNDLKVMTVPRLGYELRIVRKDIYTDSTCKLPQDITSYPVERGGISGEEGRFWFELAKKEYFFDEDRKKAYEPTH